MRTPTERQVQAIWYDASLRPKHLMTNRGSEITVVSPGEWNLGAGPDFRHAVLEIGPAHRRVVGDVEIHICPADWDLHGHGADPNYRNVIAHVTWENGAAPASLPEEAVSVWIGRFVSPRVKEDIDRIDLLAYPYARLPSAACLCEKTIGHTPERARTLLSEAGGYRLRMKARRLSGRLSEPRRQRRQIYYEEVMTALGYARNECQFRRVAERVRIDDLPLEGEAARNALLVAGEFEEWDRSPCRPRNTPENRLRSAADVFTSTLTMSLLDSVDFSDGSCRAMVKTMCGAHCMGKGRAAAILANVIVPFALAEGRLRSVPDWLPAEDVSRPVRLMASRMLGPEHDAALYSGNGLLIQGLLQVYRDHCARIHPDCEECALPRRT